VDFSRDLLNLELWISEVSIDKHKREGDPWIEM